MEKLLKKDYFYELPEELIAQDPLSDRSSSRLMVIDRVSGERKHTIFRELPTFLRKGDCLVINNTRVIPARLIGERLVDHTIVRPGFEPGKDGAQIEVLLLKRMEHDVWETIVKPGKKAKEGTRIRFGDGRLFGTVREVLPDGNRLIAFEYEGIFEEVLDALGQMPLPPYITHELADKNRYQTVYAKYDGSAAAPTAGLHFTTELLTKLQNMGVIIANVTLHVGLGTFRPVKEENLLDHHMHSESFQVLATEAEKINNAKAAGGRIFCVGTTSCRTIESAADDAGVLHPCQRDTDIFIYPGYRFKIMDGLITNFHLPESTLLMLVSAFAGREHVLSAYEEAVKEQYRFFSFGDACLFTNL